MSPDAIRVKTKRYPAAWRSGDFFILFSEHALKRAQQRKLSLPLLATRIAQRYRLLRQLPATGPGEGFRLGLEGHYWAVVAASDEAELPGVVVMTCYRRVRGPSDRLSAEQVIRQAITSARGAA